MDMAGRIDQIGTAGDPSLGLAVGDEVVGVVDNYGRYGAYSSHVVLDARSVTAKPTGADFPHAASFLMNSLTA